MFDEPHVPLKFAAIDHQIGQDEDREWPILVVTFELNPFTAHWCGQVSDFMRGTLFTRSNSEVNQQLQQASFQVVGAAQTLVCRMAPDQGAESMTLDDVTIGVLRVSRSKNTSAWKLAFSGTFEAKSERQLAQVVDAYTKMRFVTFADATPNLVSDVIRQERRERDDDDAARRKRAPKGTTH